MWRRGVWRFTGRWRPTGRTAACRRTLRTPANHLLIQPDAPVERRLRGRVLSLIGRMVDPDSHEFAIVHKEHANPTGLLAEVMRESIEPILRQMGLIVRELLGPKASDRQVELCQMTIMAQCFHIMVHERHRKVFCQLRPLPGPRPFDFTVEAMADHIVRFSLAGIREMRRQIEAGESDDVA